MRSLVLIPLLALACTSVVAQRSSGGAHFGAHFGGHLAYQHSGHSRGWDGYSLLPLYWGFPFFDDSTEYPAPAPPVVVIQQPAAAQPATPPPDAAPIQPLLIELRGGRYVRIGVDQSPISGKTDQQSVSDDSQPYSMLSSRPAVPAPTTILVFRDGSREQIENYTIAGGILYAQANYYTDGSWNHPIAISSLDLPATVNENRARGVRFQVPAGPDQVIVGP